MNMSSRPKTGSHVRNTRTDSTGYVVGFADFGQTVTVEVDDENDGGLEVGWSLFDVEVIR